MKMKLLSLTNSGTDPSAFGILRETLRRHIELRSAGLAEAGEAAFELSVRTDPAALPHEGRYIIESDGCRAVISAADTAAVFAGLGRFLEESRFDGRGGFEPFAGRIDFTPARPLRGMYFATHFHNFYHAAPVEKVYEVIGDLALRGCNALMVWFDMHHFASADEPAAVSLAERLRLILSHANSIGIKGAFTMNANEAFSSSPAGLRAEWTAQNGYTSPPRDHFHLEICPSKPGGTEEILRERREMLELFAGLDIAYFQYWPYDEGGCTCRDCAPWGANGFVKLFPHVRDLVSGYFPAARFIVSTWYFDRFYPGEWEAFYPHLTDGSLDGADYILSFFFRGEMPEVLKKKGFPKGIKLLDFPEISMYSCTPWGGFGASALPGFLGRTNAGTGSLYSGGFPYSEGIFEDVNKYITLSYYSGRFPDPRDAVRAYVRYEFCAYGEAADELTDAVLLSETGLSRARVPDSVPLRFDIRDTSQTEKVYEIFSRYDKMLPDGIRLGYKFRMWYLRSVIDREIARCGGYPLRSDICQEAMREVNRIIFADSQTGWWIKAPAGE
ncbi:MAG: hypothetical protein II534_02535 [Clostridia bacterium]|nr:hypothetical protein [Clostridia bacterium]